MILLETLIINEPYNEELIKEGVVLFKVIFCIVISKSSTYFFVAASCGFIGSRTDVIFCKFISKEEVVIEELDTEQESIRE